MRPREQSNRKQERIQTAGTVPGARSLGKKHSQRTEQTSQHMSKKGNEINELQRQLQQPKAKWRQALKEKIELEKEQKRTKESSEAEFIMQRLDVLQKCIQKFNEKLVQQKKKKAVFELEKKNLNRQSKSKELNEIKIKALEQHIQIASSLIQEAEEQRDYFQQQQHQFREKLKNMLKTDQSSNNSKNINLNEEGQRPLKKQNNSLYSQAISLLNEEIQYHLSTQKKLRSKIVELEGAIGFGKGIIIGQSTKSIKKDK